jgi:hypothetical protein
MPIETGRYCGYCTDDSGELQSFDERFARMAAWQERRDPAASRQDIERQVLDYMATMPAWREHPRVLARLRAVSGREVLAQDHAKRAEPGP